MTKEVPRTSVLRDEELIARLRERAAAEREIQANNEAVATALIGQRLLFEQGLRSAANSFAVRLGLQHENCAKNDARLAQDWDAAADRIEELGKACTEWAEVSQSNYQRAKAAEAKLAECLERNALLEARLGKAVEALENVIGEYDLFRKYEYERGLAPLDDEIHEARAALAEIKSGVATTPYGLKGESHE